LRDAWWRGDYSDQSVPINILMNHSDCDGSIPYGKCRRTAAALEELLNLMPAIGVLDIYRPATERFIKGLRLAASRRQNVRFH
jgi:hypothetical protein